MKKWREYPIIVVSVVMLTAPLPFLSHHKITLHPLIAHVLGHNILFAMEAHQDPENKSDTGEFNISVTITELLGEAVAKRYVPIMPIDESINWDIYVPIRYDPARPAGLMVYISPSDSGKIPPHWKAVMDDHNLIWIGANKSGNNRDTRRRTIYALLATGVIGQKYSIDKQRIYLTGFSGGGRVASIVAKEYPTIFKGAIYNSGVNFWRGKPPKLLSMIKSNRYVFITGNKDFNLKDTKRVFRKYKKAGVKNIKLLINPIRGHSNPQADDYEKAIKFLDGKDE